MRHLTRSVMVYQHTNEGMELSIYTSIWDSGVFRKKVTLHLRLRTRESQLKCKGLGGYANAASFSKAGLQDSMLSSVIRSIPFWIASIASSLSIPNTRAVMPSPRRER